MEDALNKAWRKGIVRFRCHLFCLGKETFQTSLLFYCGVVLACLQHDYQVCEVVGLCSTLENVHMIMFIIFVSKLLQDVEDYLGVNSCHSKSLKESTHTFLNIAICVVLALKVLFEALLRPVIFSTDYLRNLVQTDSTRVE